MDYSLRAMTVNDLRAVLELWGSTDGLCLDDTDTEVDLAKYLRRNPGLRLVAEWEGEIIAAVKCGQDGRRGYLHHLAVKEEHRRQGVGRALVNAVLRSLREQGIEKCNTFVLNENTEARAFWDRLGWGTLEYYYQTLQRPTDLET